MKIIGYISTTLAIMVYSVLQAVNGHDHENLRKRGHYRTIMDSFHARGVCGPGLDEHTLALVHFGELKQAVLKKEACEA